MFQFTTGSFNAKDRLQQATYIATADVLSNACVQKCSTKRRGFRFKQHAFQQTQCHRGFNISCLTYNDGKLVVSFSCAVLPCIYRIVRFYFLGACIRFLHGNFRIYIASFGEVREIFFIQICQCCFNIHITVQINVRVFRTIIGFVEVLKHFLSQFGNGIRITTGFKTIRAIREQGFHSFVFHQSIRRRIYAFHFVINYTIVSQFIFCVFKIVVPTFLQQGEFVFINQRIEHCVQINIHQIAEVFIVTTCNRIHGFIGISHRIEESIQRTFNQFYKGFFQMILSGATQSRVFQNVSYTSIITGRSSKSDGENFIVIFIT